MCFFLHFLFKYPILLLFENVEVLIMSFLVYEMGHIDKAALPCFACCTLDNGSLKSDLRQNLCLGGFPALVMYLEHSSSLIHEAAYKELQ